MDLQERDVCGKSYRDQIDPYVHRKKDRDEESSYEKVEIFWPHELLKVRKNSFLPYLKEGLKLSMKDYPEFFISCLILEIYIFSLKAMNCPPSWIIAVMHVTSQVGSSKVFLTASDQYDPKTCFWLLVQISNTRKAFQTTFDCYSLNFK